MWARGMWSEVYSTYGYIPTGGSRDHRQITFRFCRSLADHLQILDFVDSWIASCSLACRSAIKGSVVETCALIGREMVRALGRLCEIATTLLAFASAANTRCLEALSQLCLNPSRPVRMSRTETLVMLETFLSWKTVLIWTRRTMHVLRTEEAHVSRSIVE